MDVMSKLLKQAMKPTCAGRGFRTVCLLTFRPLRPVGVML